jgi:hypothetical protein
VPDSLVIAVPAARSWAAARSRAEAVGVVEGTAVPSSRPETCSRTVERGLNAQSLQRLETMHDESKCDVMGQSLH